MPNLQESRDAFLTAMRPLSDAGERPQFEAALDDLIAWSAARPAQLAHNDKETKQDVFSFRLTGEREMVLWSAYAKRDAGAKLTVLPGGNAKLPPEVLADVVERLQAITTEPLSGGKKLDIPFRALKTPVRRTALKEVLATLVEALHKA